MGLAAGLSKCYKAVEVSADRASSHRVMHIGILLRRVGARNGGKSHNAKKNQQGELSEVHPISYRPILLTGRISLQPDLDVRSDFR